MARAYRLPGAADQAEGPLAAALWEAGCTAVELDGDDLVAVFGRPGEALRSGRLPAGGAWEDVDERDHVAAYYQDLDAVEIGAIVVAPTHRRVQLAAGQRALWLDPGMAFGTGHHESTRLVLAALADPARDLGGLRVLDVGAGTGVLAIAADLLGAAHAEGVDVDPVTIPIARANAKLNRSRARFALADVRLTPPPPASLDLLLANLFVELHVELLPTYAGALRPGGRALLSGIIDGRQELLNQALLGESPHLRLRLRGCQREGDWWCFELEREADA
jgi:ribosomal protein L11 methyltransferase